MFTEKELENLKSLSEKNKEIERLLDFYIECKQNGFKKLFVEINKKLSSLADDIQNSSLSLSSDDKAFDRFMKLSVEIGTIQDNYEKMEGYMFGKKEEKETTGRKKGHEGKPVV